jgi:putative flippase GtrA
MAASKISLRSDFVRFLCVGATCFTLNLGVLYIVTEKLGAHYMVAVLVSIILTNALGFVLNRYWTFARQPGFFWVELGRYFTINLGQFALNMLLMAILVSGFGVPYLAASAAIALVMTGANFLLHKNWSFAAR